MCNVAKNSESPLLTWAPELLCIHLTSPHMKEMDSSRTKPGPFQNFSACLVEKEK